MWDAFLFGAGMFCGGVIVADVIGYRLARAGDPFWRGWITGRSFGLIKFN